MAETPAEVRTRRLRLAFVVVLLAAAGAFFYAVRPVLVPFILAGVIAYLLDPPVRALIRRGIPRPWAITLVYVAVLGAVALLVFVLVPVVVDQLERLAAALPELIRRATDTVDELQERYRRVVLPPRFREVVDEQVAGLERRGLEVIQGTVRTLLGVVRATVIVLFAIVLAFYLLLDLERLKARVSAFFPSRYRADVAALGARIDTVLGGFVRGQITVAIAVGLLTGAVLALLGLRFWALLGIIAAVTELIPYFGPVLGAIPAVALALLESPVLAVKVVIAYVVIQQVESAVIAPRIVGPWVGLHPLTVIFVVLAGGQLFGFLGLVLAIPVAAVARVLLEFAYERLVVDLPQPEVPAAGAAAPARVRRVALRRARRLRDAPGGDRRRGDGEPAEPPSPTRLRGYPDGDRPGPTV